MGQASIPQPPPGRHTMGKTNKLNGPKRQSQKGYKASSAEKRDMGDSRGSRKRRFFGIM